MKRFAYFLLFFSVFILASCGVSKGRFKLEGKFLHLDQGEFYVYSPDGGINGVDTIKVVGGRFTYECSCKDPFTMIVVFPNFSEQPIFAESGQSVSISADASHLKEMTVKGTKTNELMSKFRQLIVKASPPEEKKSAEQFVKDHPESVVSIYLVRKYFLATAEPDYKKAYELLDLTGKQQPDNSYLTRLKNQCKALKDVGIGSMLPTFTAYDTNGKLVSFTSLTSAPVAVISTWSTSNYDSQDLQRQLQRKMRNAKGRLKLLSINVDASKKDCKEAIGKDSLSWPNICSGDMLADRTVKLLGLGAVPDNMVLQNGKIVARSLTLPQLKEKLDQLLK